MSRVSAAMCARAAFLYHLQFRSFGASFGGVCIPAFSAILSSLSHLLFPFSPPLSLPCLLRPESCREFQHKCKRWPGRLYELFQFTSANSGSFLLRCFASPSPSPLSLCPFPIFALIPFSSLSPFSPFSLSLHLTFVYTWARHEPYRGNSNICFRFSTERCQSGQSRKNHRDERNGERKKIGS